MASVASPAVTLSDIQLVDYTLETLGSLGELRTQCLRARAQVCIERAKYVTEYLRDFSVPEESAELRRARAMHYFLSNKAPLFFDDSLLAGTTTSKPFGAPVYPELTGLTIWPELDTMSTREKNPQRISPEDAEELNLRIFPYWMERNVLETTRTRCHNPPSMRLFERIVFFLAGKAGAVSHTVPCYRLGLEKGLNAIMAEAAAREAAVRGKGTLSAEEARQAEFWQAVRIALQGIVNYAGNLSRKAAELAEQEANPARKANFVRMAEVCSRVPANPASSFREALNAIWILHIAVHAENINMAVSPGRLDQILYPYYRRDIDSGSLAVQEALELLGCLWLKLNDNTNLVPETAEELFGGAGTVPAVTVGGVDENGQDAVNDLTYLMLRVTELLKTRDPSLNARYHYQVNPREYRDRVAEVVANTKAVPAFYNDVAAIATLENQGIPTRHARDYSVIGCVELSASGRSYDSSSSILFNLPAVLELTLYNGKRPVTGEEQIGPQTGDPASFRSFEDFWKAFTGQLGWLIEQAIELNECLGRTHQECLPTPLLSGLFEGPMDAGRDLIFGGALYNSSGATHIGFADTVDSISAIEKAVFLERKYTLPQIIEALGKDFAGAEELHAYLLYRTPKYGTDDPVAVKNSRNLVAFLYETYQRHVNYRGGRYRPAYWTMTNHAGQGKLAGALPNGRKAGRVFASGITPVSQAAADLAGCLLGVASLDALQIPGGEAFNLKYPAIQDQDDLKRFSQAIEAYFQCGGIQIQFNIMSYEMLLDAKAHPENYPELLVRVSGYSAYFKDLNDAMKEEIITRTAYDLRTGSAVAFPERAKSMLPGN
ncbi:MAG TPA: pyruvate formate lyase family protein [Bryobacteraceae bacterium]|nr:pyruvate formate lyase family protein [Bryobacteraceae bacterium]